MEEIGTAQSTPAASVPATPDRSLTGLASFGEESLQSLILTQMASSSASRVADQQHLELLNSTDLASQSQFLEGQGAGVQPMVLSYGAQLQEQPSGVQVAEEQPVEFPNGAQLLQQPSGLHAADEQAVSYGAQLPRRQPSGFHHGAR